MRIDVLTLFPEIFSVLDSGILGKAIAGGKFSVEITDIREHTPDKHKKCDDAPFGGGAGMVMTPEPIYRAINFVDPQHEALRIYLSPKGRRLDQKLVQEIAAIPRLLLLCGSYEGVDQRVLDTEIDGEISIGDFVLTSGEIPALTVINAVSRYIEGVLHSSESVVEESFSQDLLEYPHYTRPQSWHGLEVPEVLVSGNHARVDEWRAERSLEITREKRPDLLKKNAD